MAIIPWNEKANRFAGKAEPIETVLHSTRYDMESDDWQAGVVLYFNPPNHSPRLSATFVLFLTEKDHKYTIRIGEPGKPQSIDLNVQSQTEQFFHAITEAVVEAMKEPTKKHRVVIHGFAQTEE